MPFNNLRIMRSVIAGMSIGETMQSTIRMDDFLPRMSVSDSWDSHDMLGSPLVFKKIIRKFQRVESEQAGSLHLE